MKVSFMGKSNSPARLVEDEEIVKFVLGDLSPERAAEVEAMARVDRELTAKVQLIHLVLGRSQQGRQPSGDSRVEPEC